MGQQCHRTEDIRPAVNTAKNDYSVKRQSKAGNFTGLCWDVHKCLAVSDLTWYWRQRADERTWRPSTQGNQEPLVVRLQVILRKQIHGMWYFFSISALTLLVGRQDGHPPAKSLVLVCRWWRSDWSFARLAPVVTITSIILSSNKIQNGNIL